MDDIKYCPKCHSPMAMIYGSGWDYDQLICRCGYQIELDTSTLHPDSALEK